MNVMSLRGVIMKENSYKVLRVTRKVFIKYNTLKEHVKNTVHIFAVGFGSTKNKDST